MIVSKSARLSPRTAKHTSAENASDAKAESILGG
jgi:hypothetical protein